MAALLRRGALCKVKSGGRGGGTVQRGEDDVAAALLRRCGSVKTVWARRCSSAGAAWGRRGNGLKVAWGLHSGGVRSAWLCTY